MPKMNKDQFEFWARLTGRPGRSSKAINAARLVILEGWTQTNAAKELGIPQPTVSETVKRIISHHDEITSIYKNKT